MNESINCINCLTNTPNTLKFHNGELASLKVLSGNVSSDIYVAPGLIDLQINGYNGVDFNTFPIEEKGFLQVIELLVKEGVTSFFPTVITNSDEGITSLLENIDQLCKLNPVIDDFVGGIHLEGPFISPANEARGAHGLEYVKAPDWELFQKFQKAANNSIKIITISPEWENCPSFIEKCVHEDIIVSLGHTIANPEQIKAAVDAGANMSTHLGNGAPLSLPRNNNLILEQLANDNLTASLIADGLHLPDSFLKVAIRAKQGKAVLVSDSTMFAGMPPGVYESHIGGKVVLNESKRLSMFDNDKLLAGAAVSILDCVKYLLKSNIADLSQAWSMASTNPEKLIREQKTDLTNSIASDIVLFTYNIGAIDILKVIKQGKVVYSKIK